ncbi:hypothetical protein BDN72DRAFT_851359 [Pluteus cervinus]|uniref:Uncharacterized protein n=1 Tax=Pluteus cervinus TaxID=181527 RepID=A0ACD3A0S1_9AGAR|nr:hypothetical protein BDN72DRAFT_851359 [Pluteus cervinus]
MGCLLSKVQRWFRRRRSAPSVIQITIPNISIVHHHHNYNNTGPGSQNIEHGSGGMVNDNRAIHKGGEQDGTRNSKQHALAISLFMRKDLLYE